MKRTTLVALVLVCAAATASAGYIQNGSFTDWNNTGSSNNIPDWTVTWAEQFVNPPSTFRDQSGIYFTVNGVIPQYGGTMALITTDGRNATSPDWTTLTSDPFKII